MNNPKVIVLILSYNGKYLLEEAIPSYLNNDYENFKVVVIDNGSTDGTRDYVNENWPEVTVVRTKKNLGYAGGFNYGMDEAFNQRNADYVLISNNDVKVDIHALKELVKIAKEKPEYGFVTGKVYYYDQPNTIQTVGFQPDELRWVAGHMGKNEKDVGQFDRVEERCFSDDVFMLVKRDLFLKTAGYDPDLKFQGEQLDWQSRAKKLGFRIMFTPDAKIWHKESMTIGKTSPFKLYYDTRNKLIIRLKNRDAQYNKKYYKWYLKNILYKPLIKNTVKLRWNYSWAIISGYWSAIKWAKQNNMLKKLK